MEMKQTETFEIGGLAISAVHTDMQPVWFYTLPDIPFPVLTGRPGKIVLSVTNLEGVNGRMLFTAEGKFLLGSSDRATYEWNMVPTGSFTLPPLLIDQVGFHATGPVPDVYGSATIEVIDAVQAALTISPDPEAPKIEMRFAVWSPAACRKAGIPEETKAPELHRYVSGSRG